MTRSDSGSNTKKVLSSNLRNMQTKDLKKYEKVPESVLCSSGQNHNKFISKMTLIFVRLELKNFNL